MDKNEIDGNQSDDLNSEGVTRLTLNSEEETITVEVPGVNIGYTEFMELIELMVVNAPYSKSEVESYITEWADEIRATKQN